jgi:hypothetical protein
MNGISWLQRTLALLNTAFWVGFSVLAFKKRFAAMRC